MNDELSNEISLPKTFNFPELKKTKVLKKEIGRDISLKILMIHGIN
jgi:hypothetical protein